jgi:hypothetical protein
MSSAISLGFLVEIKGSFGTATMTTSEEEMVWCKCGYKRAEPRRKGRVEAQIENS